MFTNSSWRRGLRPNWRASIRTRRPCSPTWMGRRPTVTCALPPSRRPLLHTCALQQRSPWARTSACRRSRAEPPPISLIRRMPLMARRHQRCTPWQCCRCSRPNSCKRRRAESSLLRRRRICALQRTSRWWRRSERPSLWVRPWALWSSFRGTSG